MQSSSGELLGVRCPSVFSARGRRSQTQMKSWRPSGSHDLRKVLMKSCARLQTSTGSMSISHKNKKTLCCKFLSFSTIAETHFLTTLNTKYSNYIHKTWLNQTVASKPFHLYSKPRPYTHVNQYKNTTEHSVHITSKKWRRQK